MNSLRIAILAPLKRAITPEVTASRPRVIFDLVSELVKRGHTVTIFGTGDSNIPGATFVPVIPKALSLLPAAENPFYQHTAYITLMIKTVLDRQAEFDVIHNHMYPEFLPFLAPYITPMLNTIHSQMTPDMIAVLKGFPHAHLVAISESAKKLSALEIQVVHNGIDTNLFKPLEGVERDYLLFVGRMSKAKDENGKFLDPKGVQSAIAIAQKSGEKLKIVGNVEDVTFFNELVKPHLSDKIEFVGEVSSEQLLTREDMVKLFQGAKAFINPINWEEPFGLVMAEALACGTPVLAYHRGSVSEIIIDGTNGFVIEVSEGVDGFITKLSKLSSITSEACRTDAVTRFSKSRMADDYERLYGQLITPTS